MTTTTWTTTADIPLNAWTPLVADMRALLDVAAAGGSTITNPAGDGPPELTDDSIAFTVQAAAPAPPLTVQFTRAAGEGTVTTNAATTSGLVVASLTRAARYWGTLLTWSTDADTKGHAVAVALGEGLFAAGERAVAGQLPMPLASQAYVVLGRALNKVDATQPADLVHFLTGVLAEVTAERDGAAIAGAMLTPKAAPAKVVEQVRAELAAPEPEPAPKKAPARRRTTKATTK